MAPWRNWLTRAAQNRIGHSPCGSSILPGATIDYSVPRQINWFDRQPLTLEVAGSTLPGATMTAVTVHSQVDSGELDWHWGPFHYPDP